MATGYRLHIKRLLYAATDSTMRTFKFPLVKQCKKKGKHKATDFTDVPEKLIAAIKHDDLFIRGPSNLADYIKYKDKNIYTLIDFWLDSLRAGVVFMPSTAALVDFVTKVKDGKSIFEQVVDNADPRFSKFFNKVKFIKEFVAKGEMRNGKTRSSFTNTLTKILRKDLTEQELLEANKFINELAQGFFLDSNELAIIGQEQQNKIWLEKFQLNKNAVDLSFNLTFYIFPEVAHARDTKITPENLLHIFDEIINKRKQWLKKEGFTEEDIQKLLDTTIGLSDNFNAFSNYFGEVIKTLKTVNGIDKIVNLFTRVYAKIDPQVQNNLQWLSNKLQLLDNPQLPGISGWHEYRSLVGGKLQSWWSNHKNRAQEQEEQIQNLTAAFDDIQKFLHKYPNSNVPEKLDINLLKNRRQSITDIINLIQKLITNPAELNTNPDKYEALESLIKQLRQQLNEYFQLYVKDDLDTKAKPTDVKELQNFWSLKIYKPRNFYGYSQREYLDKIINGTIPTIKAGIQITKHLLETLQDLPDYTNATKEKDKNILKQDVGVRRLLEALRSKLRDNKLNTRGFKELYENLLIKYVPDRSYLTSSAKTFFLSEYSTSTQKQIELNINNYAQEAKNILMKLTNELTKLTQDELLNEPKLLLDFIETSKFVIARFFRWMDQDKEWDLNQFSFNIFPAARKFIQALDKRTVKTPTLRFIVMGQVFSEFRGSATIFSKKYITAKWNVQVVGSDGKFRLSILPKNTDRSSNSVLEEINNNSAKILPNINWYVRFDTKNKEKKELLVLKGKNGGFKISKEPTDLLLQICTSKYHLQFLERLVYKPQSWQNITIKVSEPSLIVEERYKIKWNLDTELPEIQPHKTNKPILYYALPFQFAVKRKNNEMPQLTKIKQEFIQNPKQALKKYYYLGADIGEYGIAWTILHINEDKGIIEVKDYGFEYDKQIRKIQDKFQEIQHKAKTGVFLESSTVLAKLRENAIGYLRNKLHDKLIKYGGHIIYEANISGFEVGVGRVTKIYDSVKRADIGNHPDMGKEVGKQLVKHIWGLKHGGKPNSPGWQIGAAGTSYTCINCGQTIYGLGEEKDKWTKINTIANSIHAYKHPTQNIIILGYAEKNAQDIEDYKTVRKYARRFARPPLEKTTKDGYHEYPAVTEHFIIKRNILTPEQLKSIKSKRGNSALFVCPFEGCHAVTDADIQAAVVIALRGYLYIKKYYVEKEDAPYHNTKDQLREDTLKLIKNSHLTGKLNFILSKNHM